MNNITDEDRLNLKKLMNEMECENNTDKIRKLKHSSQIRDDVTTLLQFKKDNVTLFKTNYDSFLNKCRDITPFLFMNYMDILKVQ